MIIDGEEVFIIDDTFKKIIYIPLRAYVNALGEEYTAKDVQWHIDMARKNSVISFNDDSSLRLVLPVTNRCNMQCRYCVKSAGGDRTETMGTDILIKIAEKFLNYSHEKNINYVEIEFGNGGEPLCEYDAVKEIVRFAKETARKLKLDIKFMITTNGYFNENIRNFIIDNIDNIIVSLDGPKEINDCHRINKKGDSVFDTVFENLKYIYSAGKLHSISAVVTNRSINHMKEIVDFFSDNFPYTDVKLGIMYNRGRAIENQDLRIESIKTWKENYRNISDYAKNKNVKLIHDKSIDISNLRLYGCKNAGKANWIVSMDGSISICTEDNVNDKLIFGYYDKGKQDVIIDETVIDRIKNQKAGSFAECSECFCKYLCGGGCPNIRLNSGMVNCNKRRQKLKNYLLGIM